jgi:FkbM family methyltransferase
MAAAAQRGRREAIVGVAPGSVARFIARHRQNPVMRLGFTIAQMYASAFENEDWDLNRNGEARFLSSVAALSADQFTAFDVGSFAGQWAKLVLELNTHAEVHCFEVVDHLFSKLKDDMAKRSGVIVNQLGLWSSDGILAGRFIGRLPTMSSLAPAVWRYTGEWQATGEDSTPFHVRVERGDEYCARTGVTHIDYLKVDVEGADLEVVRGFERLVSAGHIDVVQFEYGPLTLATRNRLQDFYDFFAEAGMVLGKIYPRYVKLLDRYFPGLDDFRWGNYVALRPTIIEQLPGGFGRT